MISELSRNAYSLDLFERYNEGYPTILSMIDADTVSHTLADAETRALTEVLITDELIRVGTVFLNDEAEEVIAGLARRIYSRYAHIAMANPWACFGCKLLLSESGEVTTPCCGCLGAHDRSVYLAGRAYDRFLTHVICQRAPQPGEAPAESSVKECEEWLSRCKGIRTVPISLDQFPIFNLRGFDMRELRHRTGMNPREMSAYSGVKVGAISKIEKETMVGSRAERLGLIREIFTQLGWIHREDCPNA